MATEIRDKPKSANGREKMTVETMPKKGMKETTYKWWLGDTQQTRADMLVATCLYLREAQKFREMMYGMYERLYSNDAFMDGTLNSSRKIRTNNVPDQGRPTMNVVRSCVDTLSARIGSETPSPMFLTDYSTYKERNLAKRLNYFIEGEFYQTDAYQKANLVFRDACVYGAGVLKVFNNYGKVTLDRVLAKELYVDNNEAYYGEPRTLYQIKLYDRGVLYEMFPGKKVLDAVKTTLDQSTESARSVSDLVMVVEGWHLPSAEGAGDGKHIIACSTGSLLDEPWTKQTFPFVFYNFQPRVTGFFGQGIPEILQGTQYQINMLLRTITQSINLVGVPIVFLEDGSKVVKSHISNQIGNIITYRNTKPIYETPPCVAQELYAQLERLVQFSYNQVGISELSAQNEKPEGLDSGTAIREFDNTQAGRFATLAKSYDKFFVDLAYAITHCACDIAKETGKYQTVYPGKHGIDMVDLPAANLIDNPFIIKCFNTSSLPRDPAGRMDKVVEMIQSGMISVKEGRRLLDYPDLDQIERLANAAEELIMQALDGIVDDGKYTTPDPFWDLTLAMDLTKQYYNLYMSAKLEERKADMLRQFYTQCQTLVQASMTPAPQMGAPNPPQAMAAPLPQSPLVSNAVGG
jgi:hypothetical protein